MYNIYIYNLLGKCDLKNSRTHINKIAIFFKSYFSNKLFKSPLSGLCRK